VQFQGVAEYDQACHIAVGDHAVSVHRLEKLGLAAHVQMVQLHPVYHPVQLHGHELVVRADDVVYVELEAGLLVQFLNVDCHAVSWYCQVVTAVWLACHMLAT
jgi:hypothetical protein